MAWEGYQRSRREQWEMHRLSGYLSMVGMQGNKTLKDPQAAWIFSWEAVKRKQDERMSKMKWMTRAETIAHYAKHGVKLDDWQLDKMKLRPDEH